MFRLPPFAPPTSDITAALLNLGRRGGLMDAHDEISAGPLALIVDPSLSRNNRDNDEHTAGVTFLGQFLDHDMTFDTTSRLGEPTNPRTAPNARRPYFDLDSVYGDGPAGSPLYTTPTIGRSFAWNGVAGSRICRAMRRGAPLSRILVTTRTSSSLAFRSRSAPQSDRRSDPAEPPGLSADDVFREASPATWHYQWLILHEVLPLFVGSDIVNGVMASGPQFYSPAPGQAVIPVEFQIAYRFGHSMVRPSYRANFTGDNGEPFFAMVFDANPGAGEPDDLRGGLRSPRRFVGWQTFFRFPGFEGDVRPNKRIDTKLSTPLFDLPLGIIPTGAPPTSLAQRNLLRHLTWQLPSGQAIAAAIGAPVLRESDLAELGPIHPQFVTSTPLWYYVLKEAEVIEDGRHLGPVGGRIVAEVFVGLLRADRDGYLANQQDFTPWLGRIPGSFHMIDLLELAGVADKR
jgi:hypothetical protein